MIWIYNLSRFGNGYYKFANKIYIKINHRIGGVRVVYKQFNLKYGIILTKSQEGKVQHLDYDIKLVPVWKWVGERIR